MEKDRQYCSFYDNDNNNVFVDCTYSRYSRVCLIAHITRKVAKWLLVLYSVRVKPATGVTFHGRS